MLGIGRRLYHQAPMAWNGVVTVWQEG